jgi:hypothetical protein
MVRKAAAYFFAARSLRAMAITWSSTWKKRS